MTRTLLVIAAVLWLTTPVLAQTSRCADCHIANASDTRLSAFARAHVDAWDHSAHARNGVGCEKCHAGDATTFDAFRAHDGVLNSSHPASPVNRVNMPTTCGKCHTGPFVSFQRSRHYELLITADSRGPTCATCHGEVAARLYTPTGVEARCNHCHGNGEIKPRPDYGPDAGLVLKDVRNIRAGLDDARAIIRRVRDRSEKVALEEQLRQAEVPWIEARDAAHRFVFDAARERLEVSRERTRALLMQLATRVADGR